MSLFTGGWSLRTAWRNRLRMPLAAPARQLPDLPPPWGSGPLPFCPPHARLASTRHEPQQIPPRTAFRQCGAHLTITSTTRAAIDAAEWRLCAPIPHGAAPTGAHSARTVWHASALRCVSSRAPNSRLPRARGPLTPRPERARSSAIPAQVSPGHYAHYALQPDPVSGVGVRAASTPPAGVIRPQKGASRTCPSPPSSTPSQAGCSSSACCRPCWSSRPSS